MWQFAVISRLPYFCGKMGVYVVIYRSKDKNTTQGNLAELGGSPVEPIGVSSPLLSVVRFLFITIILRRNCHGQSFGKNDSVFENLFGWECLNVYQRESYPCVRLHLGQNPKIMKFIILY